MVVGCVYLLLLLFVHWFALFAVLRPYTYWYPASLFLSHLQFREQFDFYTNKIIESAFFLLDSIRTHFIRTTSTARSQCVSVTRRAQSRNTLRLLREELSRHNAFNANHSSSSFCSSWNLHSLFIVNSLIAIIPDIYMARLVFTLSSLWAVRWPARDRS